MKKPKISRRKEIIKIRGEKNETEIITSTEMEAVIKNPPKNKSPGEDGFTGEV